MIETTPNPNPLATTTPRTPMPDTSRPSLKPIADATAQEAHHASEMAKTWWNDTSHKARDAAMKLRDDAYALNDSTRRYVQAEPMKSMLLAAAAGALVAGLFSALLRRR